MDPRLFEAALSDNVSALLELLREDPVILHKVGLTSSNTPLHLAALLGHHEFAKVIMRNNPEMARELNQEGLSPLHLASTKGHVEIVRDLLAFDSKLGLVRDQQGRVPAHSAAIRGRVYVLKELVLACPESVKEVTPSGETLLHLAVKGNQYEALVYLVELIRELKLEDELVNAVDDEGNTILHLATIRNQSKMVKFLVNESSVDVNAKNSEGHNALNLAASNTSYPSSKEIEDLLRGSSGEQAGNTDNQTHQATVLLPQEGQVQPNTDAVQFYPWSPTHNTSATTIDPLKNAILLMAVMFAMLTFYMAINPPGGVWQDWPANAYPTVIQGSAGGITANSNNTSSPSSTMYLNFQAVTYLSNATEIIEKAHVPGRAINRLLAANHLFLFLWLDIACFFMSLGVIAAIAAGEVFKWHQHKAAFLFLGSTALLILMASLLFLIGLTLVIDKGVVIWLVLASMGIIVVALAVICTCWGCRGRGRRMPSAARNTERGIVTLV